MKLLRVISAATNLQDAIFAQFGLAAFRSV